MTELFHFIDWVKKGIHIWKIENYMALGPSNKLPNNYMAFCPSYNLPNNRTKIRPRSTDLKTLNLEARLQNGKVLDTYSAQTEFGLLDSCDQCTLYAWYERYVAHMKKKKKLNHTSLLMSASFSLLNKIQICCCDKKKLNWV